MGLHTRYTEEVHEQLDYLATWLPTVRVETGDVCTLSNYQLQVVAKLSDFGIAFESQEAPVEADIDYSSANEVSVQVKATGAAPITGSALSVEDTGLTVTFAHSGAVLMRMAGCTSRRIKSLHAVGERVLALHGQGKWPDGYVVISQAVEAGACTIIISQGNDAMIDLVAKGAVGQGPLTIASLGAGLQVKREAKIGAKFIAAPGLTPLVRAAGVRKRLLRPDDFRSAEKSAQAGATKDFGSVGYGHVGPAPD